MCFFSAPFLHAFVCTRDLGIFWPTHYAIPNFERKGSRRNESDTVFLDSFTRKGDKKPPSGISFSLFSFFHQTKHETNCRRITEYRVWAAVFVVKDGVNSGTRGENRSFPRSRGRDSLRCLLWRQRGNLWATRWWGNCRLPLFMTLLAWTGKKNSAWKT